jgi:ABC-type sugar transport system substrate-binding protein
MRRRALAVAMAIALAAAVAACGSSSDNSNTSGDTGGASTASAKSAGEPVKLGLIMKFPVDFYLAMKSAAQKWADSTPGVKLSVGIGHSATDDQGEINLIQSMVTQGVKGIAITPTSPAVIPALDAAVAKGVKVVLIDNDLPDWSRKSSVVATDNLKGGQLAGQFLAKQLKKGATLAVLQGVAGVPALDDRVKGMEQALGSSGIKIVGKAPTDCDQNKGVTAAADLLSAHPNVDGIYGACGPPMLGAIQAVKKAKRGTDIVLVGFDALPDEVKQIQAGEETASVAQFPAKMGDLGMATLLKAVMGESVPPNVDTGTAIVTKDNAGQFG